MTKAKAENGDLTRDEQTKVRTALRFLHLRFGGWLPLGKALGQKETTLSNVSAGRAAVTPRLAFRIARLVKIGIDDLLLGKFPHPNACPYCGHVAEEGDPDGSA